MGALIRAYDWAKNPLGVPSKWPQSLKTSVSIMLRSGYPIFVWWGQEMIMFNNDAYLPVLGKKHPASLGSKARETWAAIWDQIGPMMDQVLNKNEQIDAKELLFLLDRKGFSEECYFTFSYSPIPNDHGGVGGIFCASNEETQKVLRHRRLNTLKEISDLSSTHSTLEEVYKSSVAILKKNPNDIPFSLLYVLNEKGNEATLVGSTGFQSDHPAAPSVISLDEDQNTWPLNQVKLCNKIHFIEKIDKQYTHLPAGPWNESPEGAAVLPIHKSGQGQVTGFLIFGISPKLEFDEEYKTYFELTAGQISTVIANINAFEEERKRAEALAEIDKAKTVFFSNISHEFRTPLTLMLGPLEDVLNDPETLSLNRERVETAHRNSLRLLRLVNSLLDFSRIEAGRIQAFFKKTDIAHLTEDLASTFRSVVEKAGIKFTVECADIPDNVYLDSTMWERIVFNLLSNAFKFTFEGEIAVSLQQKGNIVELIVKDTGTGIPEEELPKLFSRFHRVENSRGRTHEGSGIGLAMVYELVRLHGGMVTVNSEFGKGTSFTVTIPVGKDHLPSSQLSDIDTRKITLNALPNVEDELRMLHYPDFSEISLVQEAADQGNKEKEKILIADDNADMREYLMRLLGKNYQLKVVADGKQALEAIKEDKPSLVLSDIMMPNMDGLGLLKELRSREETKTIPVIFISARAGEEAKVEGLEAGADDYLVKPFSAKELLARVQSNLAMSRLRKQTEDEMKKLHRTEQNLLEQAKSERLKLYNVFMQAPAIVCILKGPEHIYELVNPYYQRLFGNRELVGKPIREALPELAGQGIYELLDKVYQTGEPVIVREIRASLARDEDVPPQEGYFNLIYDAIRENGEITGIYVFANEVTDQVVARKKLSQYNEELSRKNEQLQKINNDLDNFIYTASHDLKAPVSNIEGLLGTLKDVLENRNPETEMVLGLMDKSIQRFKETIIDLTEISKTQKGINDDAEEVDIEEIIDDVKVSIADLISRSHATFKTDFSDEKIIKFSKANLKSIVYNLISNAIKYRSSDRDPEILISLKNVRDELMLSVTDNGLGISRQNLGKLFSMFKRFHDHVEGTGIGLYIVKRIIDNSGGRIEVESELDKGTTFRIYFRKESFPSVAERQESVQI